jgi:hypothetical protein
MIFSKYGEHLSPADVLDVCFEAQSEAVEAVVANNGNGPVPRLQVQYWAGNLYMSIRPHGRMRMTWLMLSHTLKGVVQFMETYDWVGAKFTVLDNSLGIVGTGIISIYRPK